MVKITIIEWSSLVHLYCIWHDFCIKVPIWRSQLLLYPKGLDIQETQTAYWDISKLEIGDIIGKNPISGPETGFFGCFVGFGVFFFSRDLQWRSLQAVMRANPNTSFTICRNDKFSQIGNEKYRAFWMSISSYILHTYILAIVLLQSPWAKVNLCQPLMCSGDRTMPKKTR